MKKKMYMPTISIIKSQNNFSNVKTSKKNYILIYF